MFSSKFPENMSVHNIHLKQTLPT